MKNQRCLGLFIFERDAPQIAFGIFCLNKILSGFAVLNRLDEYGAFVLSKGVGNQRIFQFADRFGYYGFFGYSRGYFDIFDRHGSVGIVVDSQHPDCAERFSGSALVLGMDPFPGFFQRDDRKHFPLVGAVSIKQKQIKRYQRFVGFAAGMAFDPAGKVKWFCLLLIERNFFRCHIIQLFNIPVYRDYITFTGSNIGFQAGIPDAILYRSPACIHNVACFHADALQQQNCYCQHFQRQKDLFFHPPSLSFVKISVDKLLIK